MRLKYEKGEEVVEKAKKHACDIIEEMIRQAIKDFNDAGSDSFKLVVTIECEKEPDDRLTVSAKGASSVELKRKDSTEPESIYLQPTLFDVAARNGVKSVTISVNDGEKKGGKK
jgi:hypothetical protein